MKKPILIVISVFTMLIGVTTVSAKTVHFDNREVVYLDGNSGEGCDSLLGNPDYVGDVAYYLQTFFDIMKYLGVALCIVLTTVDFVKALLGQDKDLYKPGDFDYEK